MMLVGAALTALRVLVASTSFNYVAVQGILGVPKAIVETAWIGLRVMPHASGALLTAVSSRAC